MLEKQVFKTLLPVAAKSPIALLYFIKSWNGTTPLHVLGMKMCFWAQVSARLRDLLKRAVVKILVKK